VADAPQNPGESRAPEAALPTNDCRHGDDMIGVSGVPHPEKEAE
jgi:hypothetical protein